MDEWVKKIWYTHTMECNGALKGGNPAICDNTEESGGHYAK